MFELAVCPTTGRVYEGERHLGVPIEGPKKFFPIKFVGFEIKAGSCVNNRFARVVFREDSFDPITKIRRGRIYVLNGSQPCDWKIQDPLRGDLVEVVDMCNAGSFRQLKRATHYIPYHFSDNETVKSNQVVHIGSEKNISFWKVLYVESEFDNSQLVTLKATTSFGITPQLIKKAIPEVAYNSLCERIDLLDTSVGRLSSIDVIDRCRDALSIVFGALANDMTHDLGEGIKVYSKTVKNGSNLITNAADIVKRFHSRGKPNEVERYGTRVVSEEDANLALNCLWFILVELGWAK